MNRIIVSDSMTSSQLHPEGDVGILPLFKTNSDTIMHLPLCVKSGALICTIFL